MTPPPEPEPAGARIDAMTVETMERFDLVSAQMTSMLTSQTSMRREMRELHAAQAQRMNELDAQMTSGFAVIDEQLLKLERMVQAILDK